MYSSKSLFYKWGHVVYHHSKLIILLWALVVLIGLPCLKNIITPFQSTGLAVNGSQSEKADRFLTNNLGYGHNQLIVIYHSDKLKAFEPEFKKAIQNSLAKLKHIDIPHEIIYPEGQQISSNQQTAYVVILLKSKTLLPDAALSELVHSIKTPAHMTMNIGGEPVFIQNINQQTRKDLFRADLLALPVSIITLLIIFGTLIATLIPIGIGGACAVVILALLYGIGHLMSLSIFTLNIALLLGLCLSLDYALFIISRYREELNEAHSNLIKIQITLARAGKAVFFSGLAVFVSLSALLFFPINILVSMGIGGLVSVFVAVCSALTLLPAILCILNDKINKFPVRTLKPKLKSGGIWRRIANTVVNHPIKYFTSTLIFLLFLAYIFSSINIGIADFQILPKDSKNQQFFDTYTHHFKSQELNPIELIVSREHQSIWSTNSISRLYDLVETIKSFPEVAEVNSIVSLNKDMSKKEYIALYQHSIQDKHLKQFIQQSTGHSFTVIKIISHYPPESAQTKTLIQALRQLSPGHDFNFKLTGTPVVDDDVLKIVYKTAPYALAWVFVLTYLILLILLRSIFLPLKAIFMNVLSLCTSYGVLVYIFQEGHLHRFLDFNPQGMLDINVIVIIFCALFGFSMDYEVFLLSRIHEAFLHSQDNNQSIVHGIVKSSRIITSAALIVIVLCGSFMVADVLMVKEFGLGIAVAILVDAFAIRTILVPSTMALLKEWNWYLPKCLEKLLPH